VAKNIKNNFTPIRVAFSGKDKAAKKMRKEGE
jgi:hypothetical protein